MIVCGMQPWDLSQPNVAVINAFPVVKPHRAYTANANDINAKGGNTFADCASVNVGTQGFIVSAANNEPNIGFITLCPWFLNGINGLNFVDTQTIGTSLASVSASVMGVINGLATTPIDVACVLDSTILHEVRGTANLSLEKGQNEL